jgi:ribosome-associated translation inhibitor RaiA
MNIQWVGLSEVGGAERARVESHLQRLAEMHSDMRAVRISGEETQHNRHGGREVRITCHAREREIVAASSAADLGPALAEALDIFEREVHRLRDKRRDAARPHAP